jgi:hypothetical protein
VPFDYTKRRIMLRSQARVTRWLPDGTEVTDVVPIDWAKRPATIWELALLDAAADGTYTTSAAVVAVLGHGCGIECRDKARGEGAAPRGCDRLRAEACARWHWLRTQSGLTPLALASRAGHVHVVAALLQASANVAAADNVRACVASGFDCGC